MKSRPVCLLFCLLLFVTIGSAAAEKPWIEVRSPHFRVLTNAARAMPATWRSNLNRCVMFLPASSPSSGSTPAHR